MRSGFFGGLDYFGRRVHPGKGPSFMGPNMFFNSFGYGGGAMHIPGGPMVPPTSLIAQKLESIDDRHIVSKHREIYPTETELTNIQRHVFNVEKALKMINESIDFSKIGSTPSICKLSNEADMSKDGNLANVPSEGNDECNTMGNGEDSKSENNIANTISKSNDTLDQCLKGVVRVGILAKGLLLRGDDTVDLVLICQLKPNHQLLDCLASHLPKYLPNILASNNSGSNTSHDPHENYRVEKHFQDSSIHVKVETSRLKNAENLENTKDGSTCKLTIRLRLTSPLIRMDDDNDAEDGAGVNDHLKVLETLKETNDDQINQDILDRKSCMESLAELRHAKWFQVDKILYIVSLNIIILTFESL
jgi:zinc finger RNA-binding protein